MKVQLHREEGSVFDDRSWDIIHGAFAFFINEYDLNKYSSSLLHVRFPKQLTSSWRNGKCYGNCLTEFYRLSDGTHRVRKFVINIVPSKNMHAVTNTIFHEMTHVWQELRGDIIRPSDNSEIYQGVRYSNEKLTNYTYREYRNFPWEVEARAVADQMTAKWYAHAGIKLSFWNRLINNYWS